ncbi:Mobile element protein [Candidatus Enterovibrio escicola]|uniref:Mobile element protein n=1 Tax=Candidatus Enterovibrio escicola TaxID=1927127 RepID=A0A2A5T6A6_9GAMM|nr:transposase [Candidatus Enterovibrio escacola]PCS23630.1 Mobile element protein [Candidatus Enterovibrio escacola]
MFSSYSPTNFLNYLATRECSSSYRLFWFQFISPSGITFVDSSKLQVCHNLRILRHQVFKGTAKREKGTMGWFYGFQLHLIINDQGGIISVKVTTANLDDRKLVSEMVDELWSVYTEIKVISPLHLSGNLQTRE